MLSVPQHIGGKERPSMAGTRVIHEWNNAYLVSKEWLYSSITIFRLVKEKSMSETNVKDGI